MSLDFKYIVVLVVYLLGLSAEFSDFRHPGFQAPWSENSLHHGWPTRCHAGASSYKTQAQASRRFYFNVAIQVGVKTTASQNKSA